MVKSLSNAIIFFGICLLISAWIVSGAIRNIQFQQETGEVTLSQPEENKYELIVVDKNTLILFDKETGEYWRKPVEGKGTPLDWVYQPVPNR